MEISENTPTTQNLALLVIDVQQGLFKKSIPIYKADELLENITTLVDRAHLSGVPVVYVQHSDARALVKGSVEWQLHEQLHPLHTDTIIHKQHGNAFEDTPLGEILRARNVTTVVVTGLVTHGCVKATCLGARELGYNVILVQDGHSSFSKGAARLIEELTEPDVPNPNIWQIPPDYANHQSCLYAYNLRTFVMFGYHDDPRIQERIAVLLADERHDGGYLCDRPTFKAKTKSCIRGSIKALMAFAVLPELWKTARCLQLVDYFLRRRVLFRTRQPEKLVRDELVRIGFPFMIGGSLLEPLYALSRMGYGQDERLQPAWDILDGKRDQSGRYILDWHKQTLFDPGDKGQPNKWATLCACLAHKYKTTRLFGISCGHPHI